MKTFKLRKTIEVRKVLEYVNNQLARTDKFADEKFKAGMCTMIERMLYDTGNYKGYMNLSNRSEYSRYYYEK
jgi:hypothetical protein